MSCPDCFSGSLHEGTPRGTVAKAYGLDVYVTQPLNGEAPKGVVVIIADAFGWEFVNLRLLADRYADKGGYKVYLPDFMDGEYSYSAPLSLLETMRAMHSASGIYKIYYGFSVAFRAMPWLYYNRPARAMPRVQGFFEQLRKEEGASLPIGAAGFCWGGKFTVLLAHDLEMDGKPLIDAGFTSHPSLLTVPDDIEKIVRPVSFAVGDKDTVLNKSQAEVTKAILEAKEGSARGELRIYEGVGHGFSARADVNCKENEAKAAESDDQCINWFKAHFAVV